MKKVTKNGIYRFKELLTVPEEMIEKIISKGFSNDSIGNKISKYTDIVDFIYP